MNLPAHINHAFQRLSRTYPFVIRSSISQTKPNTTSSAKHIINAPCHLHYRRAKLKRCQAKLKHRQAKGKCRPLDGSTTPLGATTDRASLFLVIAWQFTLHRQALHQ